MADAPRWVTRLRKHCPSGWTVHKSRGSIRLQVHHRGACSSVNLPFAWAADNREAACDLIDQLEDLIEAGYDLKDSLRRATAGDESEQPGASVLAPATACD